MPTSSDVKSSPACGGTPDFAAKVAHVELFLSRSLDGFKAFGGIDTSCGNARRDV
ncbi:unnamed protein product [Ascophyllum nodosum]